MNAAEQLLAQSALQAWHDVANVDFVQTSGAANITFTHSGFMQAVTNASWNSSGAIAYATVNISSDWITNDGARMTARPARQLWLSDLYPRNRARARSGPSRSVQRQRVVFNRCALCGRHLQYSIMSYFPEGYYSGSLYRYVITPQMADIYAVGLIYGAATSTRTRDTVYGFHSNAGSVFNFSAYSQAPAFTIYDSGGNDTLDCSGYSAGQTIDLHAGAFSSVGGLVNNIGIALNATIENAIGGSDTLIANEGAASCTAVPATIH